MLTPVSSLIKQLTMSGTQIAGHLFHEALYPNPNEPFACDDIVLYLLVVRSEVIFSIAAHLAYTVKDTH